jgi:hypothetical protein
MTRGDDVAQKLGPTEPKWGQPARCWRVFKFCFGSIDCGSSVKILWILTESWPSSPSGVSGFWLVRIPTTLPRSGWFANHSKSFILLSYVICEFTYRIVELVFVLSYIRSCVWGSIKYSGTWCGDYYLIPRRLTALIKQKLLNSAVDVLSEALSMHMVPPAIQIVVVPIGGGPGPMYLCYNTFSNNRNTFELRLQLF